MISINSSVLELEMQLRNRELERRADRRRQINELVHVPPRSWKNVGELRRFIGRDQTQADQIA